MMNFSSHSESAPDQSFESKRLECIQNINTFEYPQSAIQHSAIPPIEIYHSLFILILLQWLWIVHRRLAGTNGKKTSIPIDDRLMSIDSLITLHR